MIKELNTATFHDAVKANEYVIVDFYGDFCYACELLEPVFNELAGSMGGIDFCRINLSQNMEIAEELQIFDMPTVNFYHHGEQINQFIGSVDMDYFKQVLSDYLYQGV